MGGSHLLLIDPDAKCDNTLPTVSLTDGPKNASQVHKAIQGGLVVSAHDCSEGGSLLAAAEMAMGGGLGLELALDESLCFSETPSRYLLEVQPEKLEALQELLGETHSEVIGTFNDSHLVEFGNASWHIEVLFKCWSEGMVI
jgi:phosphoribosylformylglycinamidine synthase